MSPRLATLLLIALGASTLSASAADLAQRGRIGAIFAEPVEARRAPLDLPLTGVPVFAPQVDIPPLVHGYYGKPNSYDYNSYYGTSPLTIFGRLPYACGFYGYC